MRSAFALGVIVCCVLTACSDSESTSKTGAGSGGTDPGDASADGAGTGGTSAGGSAGEGGTPADASVDASGGTAGTATGGIAGTATGGSAGTATGGSAGSGGAAGSGGCALPPLSSTTTPGNSAVYFLARTGPVDSYDLYRVGVSGLTLSPSMKIPTSFHIFTHTPSPDGKRLALEAYTTVPYANPDLYVMDVQPGSTHAHCLVPKPPGASQQVGVIWSPNGQRILFENALPSSDEGPVSVVDLASPGTSWQLSAQGTMVLGPWSHDARFVAFRSGTDLLVTDLDVGPPFTPQTIATDTTYDATFIPNTHTLVYISGGLLFARDFDTTASAVQLTSTPSVARWISPSADGTRLVWGSDETGTTSFLSAQVFIMQVMNGLPTGTPVPLFPSSPKYDDIPGVKWAPGSNRFVAIAQHWPLKESGLYFVDATVFPPSFHAVVEHTGTESAIHPEWSSNGKLVTYLFGAPWHPHVSDLSQATPGAPQSVAASLIHGGPHFSPAGDLIALATFTKMNVIPTASMFQGLTVVSPTVGSYYPDAFHAGWSPSGVLFFLGNFVSNKVVQLNAWKGSGIAAPVHDNSLYEVRTYVIVPQ